MTEVKPLSGLTKTVTVMLCIFMFVLACHILTNIYELVEYAGYASGAVPEDILLSQAFSGLIALVYVLVYLITAICFLKWIYRANKNLSILGDGRMEFSPAGSIGWYFVPIATLFKPYQAMREIWTKAHKAWSTDSRLLPGWWTLWIISIIFGQIVFRQNSEIISEYRLAAITMIISNLVDIALGFTAIALISTISRAYEENYCSASGTESEIFDALKGTSRPSDILENLQSSEAEQNIHLQRAEYAE